MKQKSILPMNLQLFAEPASGGSTGSTQNQQQASNTTTTGQTSAQTPTPAFDYEKLASLIQGKQTVAEDTVLKNYFQQQGLSKEEMAQAIAAFKQQKAASQPDVNAMQAKLTQAQAAAQQAQIESAATMEAVALGIDAKTIPYLLRMADLSQVMGQDGKINGETLKASLNKVLEDIPALKPQAAGSSGFVQIGASSTGAHQEQNSGQITLKDAIAASLKH